MRLALAFTCVAGGGIGCNVHGDTDPGALASITVSPNATLFPLATQQMTAVGYDADGKEVAITPTWSVSTGEGSITPSGLYTAGSTLAPAAGLVKATANGVSGTAAVSVILGPPASLTIVQQATALAIGASQQFTVLAADIGGNTVNVVPTWSVVAGGGTITTGGIFTASSTAGTFVNTIKATANGLTAYASVVVQTGTLATLTISPSPATIAVGSTQQFTVVGRDGSGNVIPVSPVWSVAAGGGTISSAGVFSAGLAAGTFTNTVTATSGLVTARATVVVVTGTLTTITITPNPVSMTGSVTQQFTAVGRDAAGNILPITPVWSISSTGSGASITQGGLYTSGTIAGIFANEVVATSGSVVGTASVIVGGGAPTNSGFLGRAAHFAVLGGAGVSCATSGAVNGPGADIGSSPTNTVTGFPSPCTLTGTLSIPSDAANGQTDLATAISTLGSIAGCTDLSGIDLGASYGPLTPLPPGCYTFATPPQLAAGATLALAGSSGAQWTFRLATTLDIGAGANVLLTGGAIPDNVRWVVGTTATLGAGSHMQGNIMAGTNVVLLAGATLNGRALAQTGVVNMTAGGVVITRP